jgi:hypothetical protein
MGPETITSDTQPVDLQALAKTLRRSIYNAYSATLIGGAPKVTARYSDRAMNPIIGDLVVESSTIYQPRRDLDCVGFLEEIAWEKVIFGDPEFVWDEEVERRPHPTERIFYIRTLDGRRYRWSNANMVAAVSGVEATRL